MIDLSELITRINIDARPYQKRIVQKAVELFAKNLRSVLIESPTGSGKTIMALLIAKALYEHYGLRIGWVAMRKHLLGQAAEENKIKGFNVPLTFISMFEKHPPSELDMLVVDEAQHDVTGSMAHIHSVVKPKYILGLSATPFRVDRVKLCFDAVLKDAGIPSLVKEGYLSSYHHYTIPSWDVDTVVNFYSMDQTRWGKSIMYFHRITQCEEARDALVKNGITAEIIDGHSCTDKLIAAFRAGKITVLANCMKLTEGFDCPALQTVFCRPSCKSVTMQMCGRVLRKHPDFAYKQIVQCANTKYPFLKTVLPKLQYVWVDNEWRTLQVNPNIAAIGSKTLQILTKISIESPVKLPKFIEQNVNQVRIRTWRETE